MRTNFIWKVCILNVPHQATTIIKTCYTPTDELTNLFTQTNNFVCNWLNWCLYFELINWPIFTRIRLFNVSLVSISNALDYLNAFDLHRNYKRSFSLDLMDENRIVWCRQERFPVSWKLLLFVVTRPQMPWKYHYRQFGEIKPPTEYYSKRKSKEINKF